MFARVDENGIIVERRELRLEDIPDHKRSLWRPIVVETVGTPGIFTRSITETIIEPERVVTRTTHTAIPLETQKLAVKNEARRRILARFPEWKQTNMVARSVELQDVWRKVGAWTAEEQAEADALAAAWAWIKAIRLRSDQLEALDPIPEDYAADERWVV